MESGNTATPSQPAQFAPYSRLSPELRLMIWSFAAPQVQNVRDSRVFPLLITMPTDENDPKPYHIRPGPGLKEATADVRTMMSINRETRAEALKWFPDELVISDEPEPPQMEFNDEDLDDDDDDDRGPDSRPCVWFDRGRDMVFLDGNFNVDWMEKSRNYEIGYFNAEIRHLGLGPDLDKLLTRYVGQPPRDFNPIFFLMAWLQTFCNLDTVYWCVDDRDFAGDNYRLRWCGSDKVNRHVQSVGQNPVVYCWPDLIWNFDYAGNEITLFDSTVYATEEFQIMTDLLLKKKSGWWSAEAKAKIHRCIDSLLSESEMTRLSNVEFWKMKRFSSKEGLRRFHGLDPNYGEQATEQNEYETELLEDLENLEDPWDDSDYPDYDSDI